MGYDRIAGTLLRWQGLDVKKNAREIVRCFYSGVIESIEKCLHLIRLVPLLENPFHVQPNPDQMQSLRHGTIFQVMGQD